MQKVRDYIRLQKAGVVRSFVLTLLSFFVASNIVLVTFSPAILAGERQSVGEFFESYDREKDYQPATEPIITPLPGFGGNMGGGANGGSGVGGNGAGGYYNEHGKWIGEGNVEDLEYFDIEAFEAEEAAKAAKKGKKQNTGKTTVIPMKTGNWFVDTWNSGTKWVQEKVVKPLVGTVKKVTQAVVGTMQKVAQQVQNTVVNVGKNIISGIRSFINNIHLSSVHLVNNVAGTLFTNNLQNKSINSSLVNENPSILGLSIPDWLKPILGLTKEQIAERERLEKINQLEKKYKIDVNDGSKKWEKEELVLLEETFEKVPRKFYENESFFSENPLNEIKRESEAPRENSSICAAYQGPELKPIFTTTPLNIYKTINVYNNSYNCISDSSLKINTSSSEYRKLSFKITVAHELTHSYVSINPEVYAEYVKNFWEKKKVTATIYKNEKVVEVKEIQQWVHKYSDQKPISDYAGPVKEYQLKEKNSKVVFSEPIGNPEEDFSELLGYYFFKPEYVEEQSAKKLEFIKNKVLQ